MSVTQKQKKSTFFPTLLLICSTDSGQAMKEPLTCEEASKKSSAERCTYYQTAFAEAVRELPPDYNGYQKVRPLLDGAMSQLVRGADTALSQNIHTLFDTIYGRWGRLLVDRLWQVVENALGKESTKPSTYIPAKRTEIVQTFATHIMLPQNLIAQKTALFQSQQWGSWPSWLKRAQTDTPNIGLCWTISFVELLDLALKLHRIELPILQLNDQLMTLALLPQPFEEDNADLESPQPLIQPTVGLMAQIKGQVNDMIVCRGGCSSGSFWRLLYVMAGTFQEKLDELESDIQIAKVIVDSSLLGDPSVLSDSISSSSTSSFSHDSLPNDFSQLALLPSSVHGKDTTLLTEGRKNLLGNEDKANKKSSSQSSSPASSSFLRNLSPPPAPGKPPSWNPANRALSLQHLNEWQKRKEAYDAYQEWLKTDER